MPDHPPERAWEFGSRAGSGGSAQQPAGQRLGDYTLGARLGSGGFGAVYRAAGPRGEVALKVLHAASPVEALERFAREAEIAAGLNHPGIVAVHASGAEEGRCWIAYELVERARPLDQALAGLAPPERVELIARVAEAVGYAHTRGVVHRDLKPENVLVDEAGRPRVTDFGLALRADLERLTLSGAWVGTPRSMAPEQLLGSRGAVGPAADVWALGVLLFEGLSGRPAFPARGLPELSARILEGPPPRLAEALPQVDPRLDAVCLRALERDPTRRFPDAVAFARALREAAAGPPPRRAAASVALAALALLGLLGLVLAGGSRAAPTPAAPADPLPAPDPGDSPGPDLTAAVARLAAAELPEVAAAAAALQSAAGGDPPPGLGAALEAAQVQLLRELGRPARDWSEPRGAALEEQACEGLAALEALADLAPEAAAALARARAEARDPVAWTERLRAAAHEGEAAAVAAGRRCRAVLGQEPEARRRLDDALRAEVDALVQLELETGPPFAALVLETVRADLLAGAVRTGELSWLLHLRGPTGSSPERRALHGLWLLRAGLGDLDLSTLRPLTPAWLTAAATPSRLLTLVELIGARDERVLSREGLLLAAACALGGGGPGRLGRSPGAPLVRDDLPHGTARPELEQRIEAAVAATALGRLERACQRARAPDRDWLREVVSLAEGRLSRFSALEVDGFRELLVAVVPLLRRAEAAGLRPPDARAQVRAELSRPREGQLASRLRANLEVLEVALALEDDDLPAVRRLLEAAEREPSASHGWTRPRLDALRANLLAREGQPEAAQRLLTAAEARAGGAAELLTAIGAHYAAARLALGRARGNETAERASLRALIASLPAEERARLDHLAAGGPADPR